MNSSRGKNEKNTNFNKLLDNSGLSKDEKESFSNSQNFSNNELLVRRATPLKLLNDEDRALREDFKINSELVSISASQEKEIEKSNSSRINKNEYDLMDDEAKSQNLLLNARKNSVESLTPQIEIKPVERKLILQKLENSNNTSLVNRNSKGSMHRASKKEMSEKMATHYSDWEKYRQLTIREKIDDSDTEDPDEEENLKASKWIILPENALKRTWDIYIAILLLYSAIVTPYVIAFYDSEGIFFDVFDLYINFSFFIDMILNFFSAYVDNEDNIIIRPKKIVQNYLQSWFLIDMLSVIPINYILDSPFGNSKFSSTIGKVARIPKLYRLIKLTKLVRMVKIAKKGNVNKITKYFLEKLKVSANIERLIYFILGFLILNHLSACMWYLIAKFEDLNPDCWVTRLGFIDYDPIDVYIVAFYWNLTTVTTVGYGDVNAGTTIEKIYNMFIMSFGVFMYSFAIGSLSSIVSTLDAKTAEMNQKLQTLYSIKHEFKLDEDVYDRVRKIIKFDLSRNQKDKIDFLQDLPNKLKIELSQIIHDNIIKKMHFFKYATPDLIAFVTPLIKPIKFTQNEILYKLGDVMDENSNFGEIEMCNNEKLSHVVKVKSRNVELFLFKKNDFLRLSFNYKEFVNNFLQKSIIHYIKFNDEKKKAIQQYELENNIKPAENIEGLGNIEEIPEEEEYDVFAEHDVYSGNEEESNSNSNSDEINNKNSKFKKSEDNQEDYFKSNLFRTHFSKDFSNEKGGIYNSEKKFPSFLKSVVLEDEFANKNANNSKRGDKKDIQMITKSDRKESVNNNARKKIRKMRTMDEPISEINEFVENIKRNLNQKFTNNVNNVIGFLENHKIKFEGYDNERNPINLLYKLKTVKDTSERNELIDQLDLLSNNLD